MSIGLKTYQIVKFLLESRGTCFRKTPLITCATSVEQVFKVFKADLLLPSSDRNPMMRIYSSHLSETLSGVSCSHLRRLGQNRIRSIVEILKYPKKF
jgi:hypothetical protein